MRCEEVLNQLNARADGELMAEDSAALDQHLAECSQCHAAAEGSSTIDTDLRRAFVPHRDAAARLAENTVATLRASASGSSAVAPRLANDPRVNWAQVLMSLAAGFLLAVALFRPWESKFEPPDVVTQPGPVAHLAVASGPIDVLPVDQLEVFKCPEGGPIAHDSVVRTGPTERCEIAMQNGNALRLDCNTEVKLNKSDVVEVNRGRLWSYSLPGRKGLEIRSAGGTIVAKPEAQLAVDCQPPAARLIVLAGAVNVRAAQKSFDLGPDKQVRIVEGKMGEPDSCNATLETAWVNSVLALRGSQHPELDERVSRLLAEIGAAKLSLMYEDELRRLGDDGVPPLLAYLASTRESPDVRQRATAAAIVADVAQSRWIPDLIALLTDANSDVRSQAARGLKRLTGRDQGLKAEEWETQSWTTCEGPHQKWLKWWTENRDHYPAARREIPETKTPTF
jgi:ferric-dicitrate binding protein FerR (iron transport regulator)